VCFLRICDYKFAMYGFFAEYKGRIRARLSLYSHPSGKEMKVDGKAYQVPSEKVMPGQAALQFFDERGDEVWVEPKVPTVEHLK
jgi:hypothetical protein